MKKKIKVEYRPTPKDYKFAGMIRRAAFKFLKSDLANDVTGADLDNASDASEMMHMHIQDFLDLWKISEVLETKGPRIAADRVCDLDTSVREEIPQTAYDYIYGD